jgi:predicted transcriptional regulator of viral defense system
MNVSFAQSYGYRYFMHMEVPSATAGQYITGLARSGRYLFSSAEAREALGVSAGATKVALHRLAQQGLVSSPAKGYYVVVPPEYHSIGCLPADQFVPALMDRLGLRYYTGLLTAAEYHGAAHQRPQEFQVFLDRARRPLACNRVRVAFIVRKRLKDVPLQSFNTPRGTLRVSTPEATALDLVGYQHRAGGLNQVATVLAELSERIDADKLVAVASTAPPAWSQRLGYLLERVDAADKARPLKAWVRTRARKTVVLLPEGERGDAARDADWKLMVNATVEPDL